MKPNAFSLVAGSLLCAALTASAATRYVNLNNLVPAVPFTNWLSAATNIQDAVDAAAVGDDIVVTNGVYQTGARDVYGMSNRVAVTKPLTLRSVNGPAVTSIVGYQVPGTTNGPAAVRCVYLTNDAVLAGFTLTNGATQTIGNQSTSQSGGGVWCESSSAVVSNCVLTGNSAYWVGGGAYYGTLNYCTLTGNSAYSGGGAAAATLNSCALTGNSARANAGGSYVGTLINCTLAGNGAANMGGGAAWAALTNCIVYYNTAPSGPNCQESTCSYCCTTPLPGGVGNFTNAPLLVNTNGWSNLRLQAGSPCINAGNNSCLTNSYFTNCFDLDGNPRIDGGAVDVGAYEFQTPRHYVALGSANPVPPYGSWATAATNLQHAIDAASAGDEVLVTNGVYRTGARAVYGMTNRVAVSKAVAVRSVNGPAVTSIVGAGPIGPGAVRCVYLTNGAVLSGFTLTEGATQTSGNEYTNQSGGGVWCESSSAVVSNCVLTGNSAVYGGGAYSGTLNNCSVTDNRANSAGGGACVGTLNNCTLTGNWAFGSGGGAQAGTLNNCTLTGNFANVYGGGTYYGTLNNCTLTGNSTVNWGGGAYRSTLTNCIVYYNTAPSGPNCYEGTCSYCCTTPIPVGTGNFATQPLFVATNGWSNLRLQAGSPCINAGNNACAPGLTDLDGNPRIVGVAVDVGAYEFQSVHYVALSSVNPVPPYATWATAATNIQHAIDAAAAGDEVLVTNGVYQTGVRAVYGMSNRVAVTKPLTVRSVNGPAVTSIVGYQVPGTINGPAAVRCVYLTNGAVLAGFTLTNGATQTAGDNFINQMGGGVWCGSSSAVVSNCVLTGNSATWGGGCYKGTLNNCTLLGNSAGGGGGAIYATLNNCVLTGNSAAAEGGGAYGGTLNNCTLTGNSAMYGGGCYEGTLNNCIVYYNTATTGPNVYYGTYSYCCTTEVPPDPGNFTTEPLFMETNGWGNLRLQAGSPCINAGNNAAAPGLTDLDGRPRIIGGTVDVGAYEWTVPRALIWAGSPSSGLWDTATANWTNPASGGGLVACAVGDSVTFDDSGSTNIVTLTSATLYPGSVTVSATSTHYTLAGPGSLGGPMSLTKSGVSTLTLDTANTFRGTVAVNGGILRAGNGAALGSADGNTLIAGGATLDVGGQNLGLEEIVVQGHGAYGTNAIQNSGGQQQSALCRVVLAGPTTICSGANRWDVHGASGSGYLYGNNYPLTKTGAEDIWLKDVGDTGLGNIQINQGTLGFQGLIGMGNPNATVTVRKDATLGFWATATNIALVKNVVLTDSFISSGGGPSVFKGPITLQGTCALRVGTDLRLDGALSGSGGFYKEWGGILRLEGTNTYRGPTFIGWNSMVVVGANSSLGSSSLIQVDGGSTLDVRWPSSFNLGSGQRMTGEGTVMGRNIIFGSGATLAVGFSGWPSTLTIQGKLTLQPGSTCAVDYQKTDGVANDRVAGLDSVTYGGNLVLNNIGTNALAAGDALALFGAGTYRGAFATITPATPGPGLVWNTSTLNADGTLWVATEHYVAQSSANPAPPYNSWATAATNIQDAIDAAAPGALIWVSNGVYQAGARDVYGMSNRVAVTKPLTVRSLNGPAVTSIVGYQVPVTANGMDAVRCVYLTNGAVLAGFTLTNGATQTDSDYSFNQSGGGVWCESPNVLVSNCVLIGNSAHVSGGGAYDGTLNNCTLRGNWSIAAGGGAGSAKLNNCVLTGNSCTNYGGGAYHGTLNNCTLAGNWAQIEGGCHGCSLNNCIIYYNMATSFPNYDEGSLNYCCTTPLPDPGLFWLGNFDTEPLFVDTNGWTNLRLQAGSPCINAGENAYAQGATDLDGNPRIVGGTVDMGAYEFQPLDPFHAWLAQYGLPTDGSADYLDTDADGLNNWQEWCCLTCPTNALSVLRMLSATGAVSGVTVTWSSVSNRTYSLERATDLGPAPAFSVLQSNLPGLPGTTTCTDTNALGSAPRFYRVRVED